MINATALRHPSTQWNIEAAMHRALETGHETVHNRAGGEIVTIEYNRGSVGAFTFSRNDRDVTGEFLKVLRA
jgi:hypothetical protein